jgi:hypothetical protein
MLVSDNMRKVTVTILGLLFVSTLSFAELATVWKDSFTDNRSNWKTFDDDSAASAVANGALTLTCKTSAGSCAVVSLSFDRAKDFRLSALMRPAAAAESYAYGLVWDMKDLGNFTALVVSRQGAWCVQRVRDGKEVRLNDWKQGYLRDAKDGDVLSVENSGGKLRVSVDGTVLTEVPPIEGGTNAGFVVYGKGAVAVDWFAAAFEPEYSGEELPLPAGAILSSQDSMMQKGSKWPKGKLSANLETLPMDGLYRLTHTGRNLSDIVAVPLEFDPSTDFAVEAVVVKEDGDDDTGYGLVFNRVKGGDRWIYAVSGVGKYSIYSYEGGKRITTVPWTDCDNINRYESVNRLTIQRSGDSLAFGVNGRLVTRIPYSRFVSTEVGFSVSGNTTIAARSMTAWNVPPSRGLIKGTNADGWGSFIFDDGSWYVGSWKGGVPDGLGTKYWPGGRVEEGLWVRGALSQGSAPEPGPAYYPVSDGTSWGFVDSRGAFIVPLEIPWRINKFIPFRGHAIFKGPGGWGFTDARGKRYQDASWGLVDGRFTEGLALAYLKKGEDSEKYPRGFVNDEGKFVVEPGRYFLGYGTDGFSLGMTRVWDEPTSRQGFISCDGTLAIPLTWKATGAFSEGLCPVTRDGSSWGYIDRTGRTRIAPKFREAQDFHEGLAYVKQQDGTTAFIDHAGAPVFTSSYRFVDPNIYHPKAVFSEGLVAFGTSAGWGYVDRSGAVAVANSYWEARPFSEDRGAVNLKGKWIREILFMELIGNWGFVDRTGKVAVPCTLEKVGDFHGGLAAAREGGKWGYINPRGEWVIKPAYDDAGDFDAGGLARVEIGKAVTWITKSGAMIWKPQGT